MTEPVKLSIVPPPADEPPVEEPAKPPNPLRAFQEYAYQSWKLDEGLYPTWGAAEFAILSTCYKRIARTGVKDPLLEAKQRWNVFLDDSTVYTIGHSPKQFIGSLDRWRP